MAVLPLATITTLPSLSRPPFPPPLPSLLFRQDTVLLPAGGWVAIRFLANNPGVWPLHCHNLWHSYMGQKLFLVEAPDRIKKPSFALPK